ncbi:MAG: InlB B-repeat-containing protein, partial [Caldiserica bacterium]|nr:InlB B-repeat-containing protein [Caldisericota bacterium]
MKRWKVGKRDWRSWALGSTLIVLFLVQLLVMLSAVQAVAASAWVERTPAGDSNRKWLACASDATGQRLLAGDNGGRLWVSSDCGASWSEAGAAAGGMGKHWQACASDADGSTLIAAVYGGRLYRSTNFGTSWSAAAPGGLTTDQNWKAVASDTDGSTLVAAVYSGRLWLSVDRGSNWGEPRPAGNADQTWQAVACDAVGLHIMALARNGRAYASGNAGATWSEVRPAGDASRPWKACAMDADGSTLVAAAYEGRLYQSTDAGATWAELRPEGDVDRNWQAVAVDADGSHIVAAMDGGSVWTSSDGGATCSDAQPAGVTTASWQCCASSADGSRLMAGADLGRLYTGLATWSLSYACAAGGVIAGTTSQTVNYGASGTSVTAVPHAGYHFVSWSDASTVNPRTDTNVTADITVTATFAVDTFAITASAGANGAIDPSGCVSVNYGSNLTFTITANTGYHVLDVLVDGSTVGAVPSYSFTNVTANHTIAVSFSINTYTLTYTAGANGTVTGTSPQTVNQGASGTTVTATPNVGYHFVSWSDNNSTTAAARTDTAVTANVNATATFAVDTFTVTASAGADGAMDPSGSVSVNYGSTQSFTINPSTGYHVSSVLVDGAPAALTAAAYTFTNVTAAHTIAASFAINTYTIVASADLGGNISPSGNVTVNHGASQSFTISPSTGYHVSSILVDGAPATLTAAAYTFTSVTAGHTIAATFAVDTFAITIISGFHGTVTPGTGLLPCHAAQAYVVKPDAGYMIDTLTVDGVVVNEATNRLGYTVTLTSIEGPHTIVATFTSIPDLTVPVNDVPSFMKGADQTVLEDCGPETVASWATSISAGPADEAGQTLDFIVTNDNNALFSSQPAVAPDGALSYTPAANGNGTATVTVSIHDNGSTASGGVDTSAPQTFAISVTTVNDPPVNTSPPSIAGTMNVGDTVTASIGTWNDTVDTSVSGSSTLTYAYQWVHADDASGTNAGDIASA